MMGCATAVLMEMVVLPFESFAVMGMWTTTGVAGSVGAGGGVGVITTVLDAGARGAAAGSIFDGCSTGALGGEFCAPFSAGVGTGTATCGFDTAGAPSNDFG